MNFDNIKLKTNGWNFYEIKVQLAKSKFIIFGNLLQILDDKIKVAFSANSKGKIVDSIFINKKDILEIDRVKFKDVERLG